MGDFFSYAWIPILLNMSLTASAVILCVLLVRLLLRRSPRVFSYALWVVVLFRLLCPVSIPAGFSLLRLVDAPAEAATAHTSVVEYVPREIVHTPYPQVELPVPGVSGAVNGALPQGEEQTAADPLEAPVAIAALVWLIGACAMAAYSVGSLIRLRRRLVGAVPLERGAYLADHIQTPFVLGLLRPKIYLPSSLPEEERGYILLHERYHIRRLDHLAKVLAFLALCIHWFNPLVWLSFVLMSRDMEMSCDEAVLKTLGEDVRADYSASLLRLATGRPILAGAPLAFGEGDTGRRVRHVLAWKRPRRPLLWAGTAICAAAIAACAANPAAETAPDRTGAYASMEDYVQQVMADTKTISYRPIGGAVTSANVVDTQLDELIRRSEVAGLAPGGVLELWTFRCLYQTDAPEQELRRTGLPEEDGWFALDGWNGHRVVGLRYEDGSYDILYDRLTDSDPGFSAGFFQNDAQALHDWYIKEMDLDLPLYVENWGSSCPVQRFDGEGWYLYIPVLNWEPVQVQKDGSLLWRSSRGTGASLLIRHVDDPPAQDEEAGTWVYPAPEGGTYVVQAAWPEVGETEKDRLYAAEEREELRRMAESFVVDRSVTGVRPPSAEDLTTALDALVEGSSLSMSLRQDDLVSVLGYGWEAENALYYLGRLQEVVWEPWTEIPPDSGELLGRAQVTLPMGTRAGTTLTAYEGLEAACFSTAEGAVWVRPADGGEQPPVSVYEDLRSWYDEAEFLARGGGDRLGEIVISGWHQNYLEAAAAYGEAYVAPHLQVAEGSKYRYTFVQTRVEPLEEETAWLREEGEIGENADCFRLITVFVPENERAREWSMAGNTGDYTGEDPAVPEDALESRLVGYIARESNGWHGTSVGTGW